MSRAQRLAFLLAAVVVEGVIEPPAGGTPLHSAIPPLHIPS